jgi:DUF971 family protein
LRLTKLHRLNESTIELVWDDGHIGPVDLVSLRDACPCAGCQGETVLFKHYEPARDTSENPLKYVLQGAEPVGSYALKCTWGDGHGEGLYTWEHLRSLCGCPVCRERREASNLA